MHPLPYLAASDSCFSPFALLTLSIEHVPQTFLLLLGILDAFTENYAAQGRQRAVAIGKLLISRIPIREYGLFINSDCDESGG